MEKNLYIDASHPNETRIVLKSNSSIEEYEFEDKNKLNFKNNIYLGTISRVEPSLQAAFINFGRIRHGFLAFNDIQSDYYQIPTEDKEVLKKAEEKIREDLKEESQDTEAKVKNTTEEEINVNSSSNINQERIRREEEKTSFIQILGVLMIGFAVIDFAASYAGINLTPFLGSASRFSPIVFGLVGSALFNSK